MNPWHAVGEGYAACQWFPPLKRLVTAPTIISSQKQITSNNWSAILTALILPLCLVVKLEASAKSQQNHSVVWHTPAEDERAAMPIGNGRTGVNLWAEKNGDLVFYLVRNDSFSESSRLLKLGRVRIHFASQPFKADSYFHQELLSDEGLINIVAGSGEAKVRLRFFCDQDRDIVYMQAVSKKATDVTVTVENWRNQSHDLTADELLGTRVYYKGVPKTIKVSESADVFQKQTNAISWYHHNAWSAVAHHIDYQKMDSFRGTISDPLLYRTSGATIEADEFEAMSQHSLRSKGPIKHFTLRMATLSQQLPDPVKQFPSAMKSLLSDALPAERVKKSTHDWWKAFWQRSYIQVDEKMAAAMPKGYADDPAPPSRVSQAYILARYVAACQMRSDFPAHFQGGMYIVGNEHMPIPRKPKMNRNEITPDFCFHGSHYWWQNVRLLYHPLSAQGDHDFFRRFLDFYLTLQPAFESIAKAEYNADGLLMRETMTVFGLPSQAMYGWNAKTYSNAYTKNMWQQSLEISCMMLDHVDYTNNNVYFKEKVLPFCLQALRFFSSKFKNDDNGRLLISPSHAVETYWHDVENDMPTVAGLHSLTDRLQTFRSQLSGKDIAFLKSFKATIPDLPTREEGGVRMLDHAERYKNKRSNYEAPSLYGVFPFREFAVGKPNLNWARESYSRMKNPLHHCWCQTGMFAARLGLAEEAKKDILHRSTLFIPGFRFPGYFNSPFDSPPDMDGPGIMQATLQEMLLQSDPLSNKIYLLPSWPKDWDVRFKLHAAHETTVECEYVNGGIKSLTVFPKSRKADLVIPFK